MSLVDRFEELCVLSYCLLCFCICLCVRCIMMCCVFFFFQAEDGIRDLVRSRGLGDVYKRQAVLIVGRALLAVGKNFVGFLGFLEVFLRLGIVRILSLIHI